MSNPASSFHTESTDKRGARRWYREPWPWLLTAGPFFVVIASLVSAWIAIRSDDGLVAQDYYKQGLLINQRLKHLAPDPERRLGAVIIVADGGEMRATMEGLADAPPSLRLLLAHPATANHPEIIRLTRRSDGVYVGAFPELTLGRWIVTLEADAWRLPTTTVSGPLSEIRLGTADHS